MQFIIYNTLVIFLIFLFLSNLQEWAEALHFQSKARRSVGEVARWMNLQGPEMGGGSPVPVLTDFEAIEDATKDLTIEQLNEEKKNRERESIGLDKVLNKAMTMLGKMPCKNLVALVEKFCQNDIPHISENDKFFHIF